MQLPLAIERDNVENEFVEETDTCPEGRKAIVTSSSRWRALEPGA